MIIDYSYTMESCKQYSPYYIKSTSIENRDPTKVIFGMLQYIWALFAQFSTNRVLSFKNSTKFKS